MQIIFLKNVHTDTTLQITSTPFIQPTRSQFFLQYPSPSLASEAQNSISNGAKIPLYTKVIVIDLC